MSVWSGFDVAVVSLRTRVTGAFDDGRATRAPCRRGPGRRHRRCPTHLTGRLDAWTERAYPGGRVPRKKRVSGLPKRRRLNLSRTLFVLPNLITLASVFCGFNAIRIVAGADLQSDDTGPFRAAAILLMIAMVFDLLDGRVARLTKTQSAFGLQLDSLADVISFGVAPALLMYKWVLYRHEALGPFVAFLFVAGGAIRLARFNVLNSDGTPSSNRYIVGLPIPIAAAFLVSLAAANHAVGGALGHHRYTVPAFGLVIALSLLMVSAVKFRSFKDLRLNPPTLMLLALGIISSVVVWQVTGRAEFVLVWLPSYYVLIGLFDTVHRLVSSLGHAEARPSIPK